MAGPVKVLVGEGSPVMRRVIELTLAREGMQVVALPDGAGVADALTRARPDVLIVDQALPQRSGYELAALVRAEPALASVPVVLTAGAFEPVDRERAARAGCADVFVKPFDSAQLVARIRQLARGSVAAPPDTDTYFEQLSAALEARAQMRPRPPAVPLERPAEKDEQDVPTLDSILDDDSR